MASDLNCPATSSSQPAIPLQFLADLSHDLKTPLTSLKMAVHLMLEDVDPAPAPRHLALLETAAEDIERLYALMVEYLDKPRAAPRE